MDSTDSHQPGYHKAIFSRLQQRIKLMSSYLTSSSVETMGRPRTGACSDRWPSQQARIQADSDARTGQTGTAPVSYRSSLSPVLVTTPCMMLIRVPVVSLTANSCLSTCIHHLILCNSLIRFTAHEILFLPLRLNIRLHRKTINLSNNAERNITTLEKDSLTWGDSEVNKKNQLFSVQIDTIYPELHSRQQNKSNFANGHRW
ncbi:hypothetical protein RRG08_001088 [Elysia crispata]|uniref:Uncharacterized protein n=1 Tax=Elysia crispata TaxID=231223 RepID=A0AAE1E5G5_9GAST|nr:hypothetical protein RRG08_001088 [Elysia crispata]